MEQEDEDDNEESYSYDNESMSTKPSWNVFDFCKKYLI